MTLKQHPFMVSVFIYHLCSHSPTRFSSKPLYAEMKIWVWLSTYLEVKLVFQTQSVCAGNSKHPRWKAFITPSPLPSSSQQASFLLGKGKCTLSHRYLKESLLSGQGHKGESHSRVIHTELIQDQFDSLSVKNPLQLPFVQIVPQVLTYTLDTYNK